MISPYSIHIPFQPYVGHEKEIPRELIFLNLHFNTRLFIKLELQPKAPPCSSYDTGQS